MTWDINPFYYTESVPFFDLTPPHDYDNLSFLLEDSPSQTLDEPPLEIHPQQPAFTDPPLSLFDRISPPQTQSPVALPRSLKTPSPEFICISSSPESAPGSSPEIVSEPSTSSYLGSSSDSPLQILSLSDRSQSYTTLESPQTPTQSVFNPRKRSISEVLSRYNTVNEVASRLLALLLTTTRYQPNDGGLARNSPSVTVVSLDPFILRIPCHADFAHHMIATKGERHALYCTDDSTLMSKRHLWWASSQVFNPITTEVDPSEPGFILRKITLPQPITKHHIFRTLSPDAALEHVSYLVRISLNRYIGEEEINKMTLVGNKYRRIDFRLPYNECIAEAIYLTSLRFNTPQVGSMLDALPSSGIKPLPAPATTIPPNPFQYQSEQYAYELPSERTLRESRCLWSKKIKARFNALVLLLSQTLPTTPIPYITLEQREELTKLISAQNLISGEIVRQKFIKLRIPLIYDVICHIESQPHCYKKRKGVWENNDCNQKTHMRWWTDDFPFKPVHNKLYPSNSPLHGFIERTFPLPDSLTKNRAFMTINDKSKLSVILTICQKVIMKGKNYERSNTQISYQNQSLEEPTWTQFLEEALAEVIATL